jgi:hypothetical protein
MIRTWVRRNQVWQSNDPRRLRAVRVVRIVTNNGTSIRQSLVTHRSDAECTDRVVVRNVVTGKESVVRRDQFASGPRGWSLLKEAR